MHHVLLLSYTQPLDVVDQHRPAHIAWIEQKMGTGTLILTGRNEAADGGVLITGDIGAGDAEALIAEDPYTKAGVVEYTRIGFNATLKAPGIP